MARARTQDRAGFCEELGETEGEIPLVLARRAGAHFCAAGYPKAYQHNHCQYGSRAQCYRPEELHEKLLYVHHRSMMRILRSAIVTIRLRPRNEGADPAILLINQPKRRGVGRSGHYLRHSTQ